MYVPPRNHKDPVGETGAGAGAGAEADALAFAKLASCFSVFMTASGGVAGYMCSHSYIQASLCFSTWKYLKENNSAPVPETV